ncbi:MAG: hypothetical protein AAGD43_12260 [Pseudomonadota bacterium]
MGRATLTLFAFCLALIGMLASPQSIKAAGEDTDPVFVFNRICYSQVPNLANIRDMARKLAWRAIKGEELKQFTTIEKPSVLEGWDAQVGERLFRVAVVQSAMTSKMKDTFPGLGNGNATSCMLILDEQNDAKAFTRNMGVLAGKEPASKDVPEGDLLTTTWAGGNANVKVFLISKANNEGRGGLLNVTMLTKEGFKLQ